jgi:Anti-sigma-K factor rskA, C-terminal
MTADDDRIAYRGGDDAGDRLDDDERDDLDDVRALLADPSVWAEPSSDLEDAVVAAVAAHASARPSTGDLAAGRKRRARWLRAGAVIGAAAAAAVVLAGVLSLGSDGQQAPLAASLDGTELVPEADGYATFTSTDAGWRIELDATGLPRLEDGRFYQAWLQDEGGDLVAIGTFNEPDDVMLWAGVSPREFPTIIVTEEVADDGSRSPGRRVLVGEIVEG